eukprot:CAMPEP_0206547116 /NCGR_PEP_ID=MMETSP0325_2-20121206/13113_1 /ASSEMBLY_ACC=CAM_ASM_000347 /TAXON_ID=2866 /ORGANISM="Crypthecodinium cohnii, Strain Seligo" /LENGTH=156 /DNA_ID=CAMNT_0054046377 /DNA_START=667 /DNA_END=1134 /DNA_ORIENTATION=+
MTWEPERSMSSSSDVTLEAVPERGRRPFVAAVALAAAAAAVAGFVAAVPLALAAADAAAASVGEACRCRGAEPGGPGDMAGRSLIVVRCANAGAVSRTTDQPCPPCLTFSLTLLPENSDLSRRPPTWTMTNHTTASSGSLDIRFNSASSCGFRKRS